MSSKIICELQKLANGNDLRLELQSYSFPQLRHLRSQLKETEKLVSIDLVRQSDKDTPGLTTSVGREFPMMKIIAVVEGRNTVWTFNKPILNEISFRRENEQTIENISVNFVDLTVETVAPIGATGNSQTSRVKTADKMFKKTMDFLRS